MTRLSKRAADRRGGAAIEFALIAPVFLVMGNGVVEYGNYVTRAEILVAASQDAAMAGVTASSAGDYDATSKAAAIQVLNAAGMDGASATIVTNLQGAAPSFYTVDITIPYDALIGIAAPATLHAQHTMLMEQ